MEEEESELIDLPLLGPQLHHLLPVRVPSEVAGGDVVHGQPGIQAPFPGFGVGSF